MAGKIKWAIGIAIAVIAVLALLIVFTLLADFDGDGLKNKDEFAIGTDIFTFDTDGDGLGDGIEVNGSWHIFELKQQPSDSHSFVWTLEHKIWSEENSQTDYSWPGRSWNWPSDHERVFADNGIVNMTSNPLLIDTDDDGLNDGQEYRLGTDPRSKDSDNDGLWDEFELTNSNTIPLFRDSDSDLLGDKEEIETYRTDPMNWDSDGDHLSDGIEIKGYDVNGDGIIEVNLPGLGANPLVKDIFVEVDWMPGARTSGSYAKEKLAAAFAKHDMVIHIDAGELGGGTVTQERVSILYDDRPGAMNDLGEFKKKYFTPSRWGLFYWGLIASGDTYSGKQEVGGFDYGDGFALAGMWTSDALLGSAFMHELGHGLGLSDDIFPGIDSQKYSFSAYRSVMNYNAPFFTGSEFYDYSSGGAFNDWKHIDFKWMLGRHSEPQ